MLAKNEDTDPHATFAQTLVHFQNIPKTSGLSRQTGRCLRHCCERRQLRTCSHGDSSFVLCHPGLFVCSVVFMQDALDDSLVNLCVRLVH